MPDEVCTASSGRPGGIGDRLPPGFHRAIYPEEVDFLKTAALRKAIHSRERGRCFYCLRQLTPMARCLDHVVPRAVFGGNSYPNLVSCCLKCNSQKGERSAIDFLRRLYRDRRLSDSELADRLRALDALASGKLPPALVTAANQLPRKGRPPRHSVASWRPISNVARRNRHVLRNETGSKCH